MIANPAMLDVPRELCWLGAGFGMSRATAYRYRDEVIAVLAAQAPPRPPPASRAPRSTPGTPASTTASAGNVHAVMRPDGFPVWTSEVVAGHQHDLSVARTVGLLGALHWAASQLALPTPADGGYEGVGHGIHTPIKQPGGGQTPAPDNQTYNSLHRATRCRGERGSALLTGRWRALRRITASPRRIGDHVKAGLVLLHIEQVQLRNSR